MGALLSVAFVIMVCWQGTVQNQALKTLEFKGPVKSMIVETKRTSQQTGQPYSGSPGPPAKYMKAFDREGRLTEELYFDPDGRIFNRTTRAYTTDGSETQTTFKRKYDSAGRVVETLVINGDGTLNQRLIRNYDSQGRFVDGTTYDPDGSVSNRSVVTYDEKGKIQEFTLYNGSGGIIHRQVPNELTYVENPGGTLPKVERRNESVEEEIDAHGNWTRQKTLMTIVLSGKSEEVVQTITRTINYY